MAGPGRQLARPAAGLGVSVTVDGTSSAPGEVRALATISAKVINHLCDLREPEQISDRSDSTAGVSPRTKRAKPRAAAV